ncbi:TPA: hypothetical protein N0F65_009313, partial [Lagenidium giganteum]
KSGAFPPIAKRHSPQKRDKPKRVGAYYSIRSCLLYGLSIAVQGVELPRVSSITFADGVDAVPAPSIDSGEELEVLKCILVREGYVQRLVQASATGKVSGAHLGETVDVLDLLRVATLEVVEAIVAWRKKKRTTEPYKWNSVNYLLKLPSDLDFLQKHQGLVQWLGFTIERNPFVLPVSLDCRDRLSMAKTPIGTPPNASTLGKRPLQDDSDSGQFMQVGGKRALESDIEHGGSRHNALLAERKRAKNPYETRVLNDEELVPVPARTPSSNEIKSRPKSRAGFSVLSSPVGELDLVRIHAAERVVLNEEAVFGRFTRDGQGRLVPEAEAQRRNDMMEMSGGAYKKLHLHSHPEAAAPAEETEAATNPSAPSQPAANAPPVPSVQGKLYGKKKAGMLGPVGKPQRKPITKPPVQRSRGAHMEEALALEKQANLRLGRQIESMKEELERKQMDVANFESYPGIHAYEEQLHEYRTKAYEEMALLRKTLAEKIYIYETKMDNIDKKQEILHVFKETQKAETDAEKATQIQQRRKNSTVMLPLKPMTPNQAHSNQAEEDLYHTRMTPLVHHICATSIQRIARGMLARSSFGTMKIEYYVSSKYIQAVVRGFLVRRRNAKLYWSRAASLLLQRYARGLLARKYVARMRAQLAMQRAAVSIEKTVRGFLGRVRMRKVRGLFQARHTIVAAHESLCVADLHELADACLKMVSIPSMRFEGHKAPTPLTPLVLALVRMLMLGTSDHDEEYDVSNVRWKEAAHFLRCAVSLLRRMKKVGVASQGRYLRVSPLANALLRAYEADQDFNLSTFQYLERGWKAASAIFQWIKSFCAITALQTVLPPIDLAHHGPFVLAKATTPSEAEHERVEALEYSVVQEDIERRFVPAHLVQATGYPHNRPRPVIVVFARDVPHRASAWLRAQLLATLPGSFIVMNKPMPDRPSHHAHQPTTASPTPGTTLFDLPALQSAFDVGYNIILEFDVGLTDARQRRFLSAFAAVKAALHPAPLCVLVRGSPRNRAETEEADETEPEHERDSNDEQHTEDTRNQIAPMADAHVKRALEEAAENLYVLSQDAHLATMQAISADDNPMAAFVLVLEAVIVLLTPSKSYDGPKSSTSAISWKLGRRLLGNPRFLLEKLYAVEIESISRGNLVALDRYLRHPDWPTRTFAHSCGTTGGLLWGLASWVMAIVACAHLREWCQGFAPEISRAQPMPGLFGSVVVYRNTLARPHTNPHGRRTVVEVAMLELLEAVLADVRVYRAAIALEDRRVIINVAHDCLRVYLTAYDPKGSWHWHTVISESDINTLLSPNSIERSNVKTPPQTKPEMYDRLVRLCLLQPIRKLSTAVKKDPAEVLAHPSEHELVVRPQAIRLFRHAIKIDGRRTTVTLSELSRGRIQVDAFVHLSAAGRDLRCVVDLESIRERMSNRAAQHAFVAPRSIPPLVLNRVHLFRVRQAAIPCDNLAKPVKVPCGCAVDREMTMKLRVRSNETAPGRLLVRQAVRSVYLTGRWILSIYEDHVARDFRVELYQPRTCERSSVLVAASDLATFLPVTTNLTSSKLSQVMKHFQILLDNDTGEISGIHTRRVLARFPCSIPFVLNPHHELEERRRRRMYIQVERVPDTTPLPLGSTATTRNDAICFRAWLPDTCEQHLLRFQIEEFDSFFPDASWMTAPLVQRRGMCRKLVQAFWWDPARSDDNSANTVRGRLVVILPCGEFESVVVPPPKRKAKAPTKPPTRSKRSMFTARGSISQTPVLASCIQLLDEERTESDDEDEDDPTPRPKYCYTYNTEEMVHKGSYRANGVLVVVQVFMKVIAIETLVQRTPTDRVRERDSFVLTFHIYHPPTSARAVLHVNGRRELREVVGPDRAALISAETVDELMQHVLEARTEVILPPPGAKPSEELNVVFQKDRLYAKHKMTPVDQVAHSDQTTNAPKLIDKKEDRGLKLLSKARVIGDMGRVIFTVFDVGFTRAQDSKSRTHDKLAVRLDAYVSATSQRLSLSLESVDLAHVVGEDIELLRPSVSADDEARMKLAQLLIDHAGIETRKDGTPDRLYLVEHFAPVVAPKTVARERRDSDHHEQQLFKTVRQVAKDQVVLTIHRSIEDGCLHARLYDPLTSVKTNLDLPRAMQQLLLGRDDYFDKEEDPDTTSTFQGVPRRAVINHVCSFLRLEKVPVLPSDEAAAVDHTAHVNLSIRLQLDVATAEHCVARLVAHVGDDPVGDDHSVLARALGDDTQPPLAPIVEFALLATTTRDYCAVRIEVVPRMVTEDNTKNKKKGTKPAVYAEAIVFISVYCPAVLQVVTKALAPVDIDALLSRNTREQEPIESLQQVTRHVRQCLQVQIVHSELPSTVSQVNLSFA